MRVKNKQWLQVCLAWRAVALCLLLGLFLPSAMVSGNGTVVSIDAPAEVALDSDFIARVEISPVEDFDAAQFDVTYDKDVIEVTDITAGLIDGTDIPVSSCGFIPPGIQSRARIIANVSGTPGVTGTGYLAELHFQLLA